ncbi:hypothetical protein Egran_05015 [Elaphomyces granulatus]|uniref:JmjC domain-containing histone demethylation protein 1 n=1 Tax=Elaphomyces granulatus TaxID=519963 RepID=A0A232LTQ9_9EURO|nr:hypothetical protein Egran_05015 [Elaphomyces granulatus]
MTGTSSFLDRVGGRPPRYRTPSPPRRAIEPISPAPSEDVHILWNERSAFRPLDGECDSSQRDNGFGGLGALVGEDSRVRRPHSQSDGGMISHRAHGHGRSGSTIDTLATIALATSPTFTPLTPLTYELPVTLVGPAVSPTRRVMDSDEIDERPAKRARSEKDFSPSRDDRCRDPDRAYDHSLRPQNDQAAILDSMKTDAELLLNFARPCNFPPLPTGPPKSSTVSPSGADSYVNESKWSAPMAMVNLAGASFLGTNSGPSPLPTLSSYSYPHSGISPSRIRSHSDGSTAIVRPVIPGLRPNTSSSNLPPVSWDVDETASYWGSQQRFPVDRERYADRDHGWNRDRDRDHSYRSPQSQPPPLLPPLPPLPSIPPSHPSLPETAGASVLPETKMETESVVDANEASCAACNLVRISINGEEQGEVTWINCDGCKRWFHIVCAGFKNDREVRTVDKFICRECRPTHGQTTFVRKSSRARTAIDYAGLHQGLVKTSPESPEHHYIQPIKECKIRFLPDNFPRMRPELVTKEWFERGIGMTEPIVIPASLNSRRPATVSVRSFNDLVGEVSTREMFDELLEHLPFDHDDDDQSHEGGYDPDRDQSDDGRDGWRDLEEEVVDCGQDLLDMVIPEGLTVRRVAELYGPEERVGVIDVKSQQAEEKKWNMQKWADYYESTGTKVVRNVISLEVSQSRLGRLLRRPKIVRDLDLQDAVWPAELKALGEYPNVQFYCLMSVADCYTDFHIDFGGSSVFYTILKGKKTFFFIPPKEKHLKKYEEWCNSPAQDTTFLGDQTKECYRVDLSEGDTMLIPAGWIHAVWTPENSLVIGGNFLTRLNYGMQIKVAKIEKDTKVAKKFRYPFFQKIQWYTAVKYLEEDPIPDEVLEAFVQDEHYRFHRDHPVYYEFGEYANMAAPAASYYNARFYSQAELEGLPDLARYLLRTALIAGGHIVDGVTMETRNAIRRSIPKGLGDPLETVRKFGIWVAWKRGNEEVPQWARPGAITANFKLDVLEKRPTGRPSRRSERNAEGQRMYAERQALRRLSDQPSDHPSNGFLSSASVPSDNSTPVPYRSLPSNVVIKDEASKPRNVSKGSGLGPKRVACDACRKRRIRCRHKDEPSNQDSFLTRPSPVKPVAVNSLDSEMNLQQQSLLARDAASVLNSLAAVATNETVFSGLDRLEDYPEDANGNPTLLEPPHAGIEKVNDNDGSSSLNSAKKGRSKACDECRKSKRRCIHDEYGRIDPIKAQERSKPRVSSNKRPHPIDEVSANKRQRQEGPPASRITKPDASIHCEEELAALSISDMANGLTISERPHLGSSLVQSPPADDLLPELTTNSDVELKQMSYASPPTVKVDVVTKEITSIPVVPEPVTSLVSPPTSLAGERDLSPDHINGDMRPSVEGEHESEHPTVLHTPTSSSRHSSRQPRQVDRFVPEVQAPKVATRAPSARHRSSTSSAAAVTVTVVHSKPTPAPQSSMKKPLSRPPSSHTKKSVSPVMDKKAVATAATSASPRTQHGKAMKRDRVSFTESETDLESLRLIRELQEQEFGLRRRAARV